MHKKTATTGIRACAGFTLLELLIVMMISAIVMMIAMPGVQFRRGSAPIYSRLGDAAITFAKREAGLPAVTFTRDGSAGEMGGCYIASVRASASAAYNRETRAFEISRATGRPTPYAYTGTQWQRSF